MRDGRQLGVDLLLGDELLVVAGDECVAHERLVIHEGHALAIAERCELLVGREAARGDRHAEALFGEEARDVIDIGDLPARIGRARGEGRPRIAVVRDEQCMGPLGAHECIVEFRDLR